MNTIILSFQLLQYTSLYVHKEFVEACVRRIEPNGRVHSKTNHWGAMTQDLWRWPIGWSRFTLLLVNARHLKQVPGRNAAIGLRRPQFSTVLKILTAAILLAFSATVMRSQRAEPDQVDDYVKQRMHELHIPGLSMAVVKEGQIVKASGYGMANLETSSPATPETVYKAASLSKPFIAAAILLLMQEGQIGLDDKVSKYLEGSPVTWKEITVRHLLTHTSGIVRDPADYHPYSEQPITDVIRSVYPVPLSFPPGYKWLYSNVGY
jgi:Beta-lactamase